MIMLKEVLFAKKDNGFSISGKDSEGTNYDVAVLEGEGPYLNWRVFGPDGTPVMDATQAGCLRMSPDNSRKIAYYYIRQFYNAGMGTEYGNQ